MIVQALMIAMNPIEVWPRQIVCYIYIGPNHCERIDRYLLNLAWFVCVRIEYHVHKHMKACPSGWKLQTNRTFRKYLLK